MWSNSPDQQQPQSGQFEPVFLLAGIVAAAFVFSGALWLAAALTALLAGGGWPAGTSAGGILAFAGQMIATRGDVVHAWHHGAHAAGELGPVWLFWVLAVLLLVTVLLPLFWLAGRYRNRNRGSRGAQWANRQDEKPMVVPEDHTARPWRLVAGWSETTRRLLAAADCMSAIVFGPNGSGKTVSYVVPNAEEWVGPAVISVVKSPDLDYMLQARENIGPVHIFAPTNPPGLQVSRWSPVAYATDEAAAARMARWLCEAVGIDDPSSRPWMIQARQFVGPLLLAANRSGRGIDALLDFVQRGRQAQEEVREILRGIGAQEFARQYTGVWTNLHEDGQGSVMFTANTIIDPYLNPEIRKSAATSDFTAEDIIKNKGTLFIVSPPSESKALGPVCTALLASVIYEAEREYERINVGRKRVEKVRRLWGLLPARTRVLPPRPLKDRLLLDLDEAGNVFKYPDLAKLSSTGRGMGIQLFAVFHDFSQLVSMYGENDARTIVSQCKCRIVLPGLADDVTLDYFSEGFGKTVQSRTSVTTSTDGRGSSTTSDHETPLIAPWQIQQLEFGHAIVQYSNLPPARVRMRNAETDKRLLALAVPRPAAELETVA